MSDYSYTPISDSEGQYEFPDNPLSLITEQQIKDNYCFVVTPDNEVVFFKTSKIWSEAQKILVGYKYQVFYCFEVLRSGRFKNTKLK
jgi:hypothetical protein